MIFTFFQTIFEAKLYLKMLELTLIRSMPRLKISLFGALLKLKCCLITSYSVVSILVVSPIAAVQPYCLLLTFE